MPESAIIARHLLIEGRVQGVGYRASAHVEAQRLGLRGWVRNRRDGAVEALVAGSAEVVEQFVAWARRGPDAAQVTAIEVTVSDLPDTTTFVIKSTV